MSRRRPPGITPAGLIVTATLALVVFMLAAVLSYRFARDGTMDQAGGTYLLGLTNVLAALLVRVRPDPAATIEQPATITATPEEP